MALRNILQDGDPALKKVSRPVVKFDNRLAQLLDDMADTMLEANGLGLAAPQVGVLRRLFVALDERDAPGPEATEEEWEAWTPKVLEMINPELVTQEGEIKSYEGCLSFPGRYGAIVRPQKVKFRAQNRFGEPFEVEAEGVLARCFCHETNHLDGITIDDLAEYFYDPAVPHELDAEMNGGTQEEAEEEGMAEETKAAAEQG